MLVRLRAAGVNPVDDKLRSQGTIGGSLPVVLGWDGAGVVEATGPAVTRVRPGDAVFFCDGGFAPTPGTYQETKVIDERCLAPSRSGCRSLWRRRGEQAERMKFMIRDRGSNFTTTFDAVLADAGIRTVLCNVRTPRMNAIAERWIGGCRRELLDRTLIWNQLICCGSCASTRPTTRDLDQYRVRKAGSRGWPDQRISLGRMTWMRLSAPQAGHNGTTRPQIQDQFSLSGIEVCPVLFLNLGYGVNRRYSGRK